MSPVGGGSAGWHGTVVIRPGLVAYSGEIGAASPHAHAAVQMYWCERGAVRVADESGRSVRSSAAVIPTGSRHAVSAEPGTSGATNFLDPSRLDAPAAGPWTASVEGWTDAERVRIARTTVADAFTSPAPSPESFGSRVDRWVRSCLPDPVRVTDLAGDLAVSPVTLRRLARAELGLGVQSYVRWVRLIVALEQVALGFSVTDAAAAAGFADGSHATRACREMFGLTPSEAIARLAITHD